MRDHLRSAPIAAAVVAWLAVLPVLELAAAELRDRTAEAYDEYFARARSDFLARAREEGVPELRREGVLSAGPAREDGIIGVPGGLVHNWRAAAFAGDVTLRQVVDVSQAYSAYSAVYRPIIASRVLEQHDDTFRVLMRLKEAQAGISAVLEIRSTIRYTQATDRIVYTLSNSDEIREVKDAGGRSERLLPPGRDSGYLWRASTFTRFVAVDDGVFIEMETLGLSRRFPPLLGWLIEPIARRLGRRSVETSLQEFLAAIHESDRQG